MNNGLHKRYPTACSQVEATETFKSTVSLKTNRSRIITKHDSCWSFWVMAEGGSPELVALVVGGKGHPTEVPANLTSVSLSVDSGGKSAHADRGRQHSGYPTVPQRQQQPAKAQQRQ